MDSVKWLGFDWNYGEKNGDTYSGGSHPTTPAIISTPSTRLLNTITAGHAYVDSQSAEDMAASRGDFSKPGVNSPFRDRPAEESPTCSAAEGR